MTDWGGQVLMRLLRINRQPRIMQTCGDVRMRIVVFELAYYDESIHRLVSSDIQWECGVYRNGAVRVSVRLPRSEADQAKCTSLGVVSLDSLHGVDMLWRRPRESLGVENSRIRMKTSARRFIQT